MSDISAKGNGFGIGELGSVPASTLEDELDAAELMLPQRLSWAQRCQREASCLEDVGNQTYAPCGQRISERLYLSGMRGSCVMCEHHWAAHHARFYPQADPTFEGVMAAMRAAEEAEARRSKRCTVCRSPDAHYNGSAGQDLCARHWDSY